MFSLAYTLRQASTEDAEALTALAHTSKAHWGYPQSWLDIWRDELTFTPESIFELEVELVEWHEQIVAVYALAQRDRQAELEALWVHPDHMDRGLGKRLFMRAAEKAGEWGANEMVIVSDPHAEAFYVVMGAELVGEVPSQPKGRTLPVLVFQLN